MGRQSLQVKGVAYSVHAGTQHAARIAEKDTCCLEDSFPVAASWTPRWHSGSPRSVGLQWVGVVSRSHVADADVPAQQLGHTARKHCPTRLKRTVVRGIEAERTRRSCVT